jgi:hypothetical protein
MKKTGLGLGILALVSFGFWSYGPSSIASGRDLFWGHFPVAQAPRPAVPARPRTPEPAPSPVPETEAIDELFRQIPILPSPRPLPTLPCPRPMRLQSVRLQAPPPSPAVPLQPEIPATIWSNLQGPYGTTNWSEPNPNKVFAHTFQWNPPCKAGCRLGGTLTFAYRNNLPASSNSSPDAGNDKYYVYNGGTLTQSGFLYASPVSSTGQTFTKTLTLSPAEVANNKVTLVVQDDTAVLEAKVELNYCCCECEFPI